MKFINDEKKAQKIHKLLKMREKNFTLYELGFLRLEEY